MQSDRGHDRRSRKQDRPTARDAGDWKGWLAYFLEGVAELIRELVRAFAAILRMRENYRAKITEHLGRAAANGQRVMDRLFGHPIVTVATVRVVRAEPGRGQPDRGAARGHRALAPNHRLLAQPAVPLRAVFALVRGGRGGGGVSTEKGMSSEPQAEAARRDAAIARNLRELGYGR